MGEWRDVVVDDQLPLKIFERKRKNGKVKRGSTFNPDNVDEYWALLLEKVTRNKIINPVFTIRLASLIP